MIPNLASVSAVSDPQVMLGGQAGDAPAGTFMAMFAQSLKTQGLAGASEDLPAALKAGLPVTLKAELAGKSDVLAAFGKSVKSLQGEVDGEWGATESMAVDNVSRRSEVIALLTADADLPGPGKGTQTSAETASDARAAVMALFGTPVVAASISVAQGGESDVSESSDGNGSEPPVAGMAADAAGKKLPKSLATLAGQLAGRDAMVGHGGSERITQPSVEVNGQSPVGVFDSMLKTSQSGLPLSEAGVSPVTLPVAQSQAPLTGQESALLATARSHASAPTAERMVMTLQQPLGSTTWQQEFGDKLVWMAGRQGQSAELVLNPPSLGAVEVRLNLHGSEASAQFFSANPHVRDIIESALPRLREMMGGVGLSLGQTLVSDQSFGQRDKADQGPSSGQNSKTLAGLVGADDVSDASRISGTGLLDYFA